MRHFGSSVKGEHGLSEGQVSQAGCPGGANLNGHGDLTGIVVSMVILNSGSLPTRERISPKIIRNISTRKFTSPLLGREVQRTSVRRGAILLACLGCPHVWPARCGFSICCFYQLTYIALSVNRCCLWHTRFDIFTGVFFSVIFAATSCIGLGLRISSHVFIYGCIRTTFGVPAL